MFSNCYNQRGRFLCLENLQEDELNVNVGCAFIDVTIPGRQNQDTRKIRMCFSRLTSSFDDSDNATKPREQRSDDYIENIILPAIENMRVTAAGYERGTHVDDKMAAVIGTDGAHEMVTTLLSQKMQIKFRDAKISKTSRKFLSTPMQDKQSGFRSIKKKESTTRKIHFNFQADGAAMLLRKLKEWKVNARVFSTSNTRNCQSFASCVYT